MAPDPLKDVQEVLKSFHEAFPPRDTWSPEGRRVITVQVANVTRWHSAQCNIVDGATVMQSVSYYKFQADRPVPVHVTIYAGANYKDMLIDNEAAAFGHCNFQQESNEHVEEVRITLYLDDEAFSELAKILDKIPFSGKTHMEFQLRRHIEENGEQPIFVTRYDLVQHVSDAAHSPDWPV